MVRIRPKLQPKVARYLQKNRCNLKSTVSQCQFNCTSFTGSNCHMVPIKSKIYVRIYGRIIQASQRIQRLKHIVVHSPPGSKMIPESGEPSSSNTSSTEKDDGMLAGYRECATEALNWLLNLGYEPGHPLIRSLAAHLTKKQAYLEKINLEQFLIDETFKNSVEPLDEDSEVDPDDMSLKYKNCMFQIQNDKEIQKALVDAVFKGCDLQYCNGLP